MSIVFEERSSDSLYVESITHGRTLSNGSSIRPAESRWHMVIVKHNDRTQLLIVGPWTTAGVASWGENAEIVWIRFKLGAFMPHLLTRNFLDSETTLPDAINKSFWLNGSVWQIPDHENADTFIDRLVREAVLVYDPIVTAVLQGHPHDLSARTVRHRFLQATGLTHSHIYQMARAQRAAELLEGGTSILDTVNEAGYFDQPHLTRSLKRWVGYTPAQIINKCTSVACHSVQDSSLVSEYDRDVLMKTPD